MRSQQLRVPWQALLAWSAMLPLSLPALRLAAAPALAAAAEPMACPAAAKSLLDGLYRWHLAQQNNRGPLLLTSQRQRFTAELYDLLVRAADLTPADGGGFLDFDVFSGTQVSTFGARVRSCKAAPGAGIEALVAVQAGLRPRPSVAPMLLRYRLVPGPSGNWRIADITYPDTPSLQLSSHLRALLKARP